MVCKRLSLFKCYVVKQKTLNRTKKIKNEVSTKNEIHERHNKVYFLLLTIPMS